MVQTVSRCGAYADGAMLSCSVAYQSRVEQDIPIGLGPDWPSSGHSTKVGRVAGEELPVYMEGRGADGLTAWHTGGWGYAVS